MIGVDMPLDLPHMDKTKLDPVLEEPKMRMMNKVLMEPGNRTAPPKRRTRKAKRAAVPIQIGTIHKFFSNLQTHKECGNQLEEGGGNRTGVRKRKGGLVEAMEHQRTSKSRRLIVETVSHGTTKNSRTECPLLLGANSFSGRDPDDRLMKGTIGLDLLEEGAKKVEWSPMIGQTDVGKLNK